MWMPNKQLESRDTDGVGRSETLTWWWRKEVHIDPCSFSYALLYRSCPSTITYSKIASREWKVPPMASETSDCSRSTCAHGRAILLFPLTGTHTLLTRRRCWVRWVTALRICFLRSPGRGCDCSCTCFVSETSVQNVSRARSYLTNQLYFLSRDHTWNFFDLW